MAGAVVDAAFKVHRALGPGLLESVYETCLAYELGRRALAVDVQRVLPIRYEGVALEAGFRADLVVAGSVLVEIKTAEKLQPIFIAQLLTYLKMTGLRLGLLVNFNVPLIRDGIRRVIL